MKILTKNDFWRAFLPDYVKKIVFFTVKYWSFFSTTRAYGRKKIKI